MYPPLFLYLYILGCSMIICDCCNAEDGSIVIRGQFTTKAYCVDCHAEMDAEAKSEDMSFLDYWGF